MIILFYISAAVTLISTVMVITVKNAIHSLLFLIVSFLSVAVIFYLMGAPFIAALEVITYAGAIMVLFVFVIMMLNVKKESDTEKKLFNPYIWIAPTILAVILVAEMAYMFFNNNPEAINLRVNDAKQVGVTLYGPYLIGVELAGFLLLSGIVGAYHLGYKKKRYYHRFLQGKKDL